MRRFWLSVGGRPGIAVLVALTIAAILAGVPASGCGGPEDEAGDAQLGVLEIRHAVTATSLVCPFKPADPATRPGAGNQLVSVTVRIVNESSRELIIGPANFRLETGSGATYSYDFDYEGADALPAVSTIGAGREVTGVIVYEIPSGETPSKLIEDYGGRTGGIELPAPF